MRVLLTGNTCFKIANFRAGLIRALIEHGHEVIVLAPLDDWHTRLVELGCAVHDLPMDRNGTSPLAEAQLLSKIYMFIRRERPDFVFSYTIKNNIYSGLACRWLGIPFIPNVTGLGPAFNDSGVLNWIVRALYRLAFERAETVYFQNPDDRAMFLGAGLTTEMRAELLPGSGVDLHNFAVQPLPDTSNGIVFLLIARLLWDKGIGLYVEAAQRLRETHPEARFGLLGPLDHVSRSAIPKEQILEWDDKGDIQYLGQTQDVRPSLAAAHCIVLPSWYREGTPRVLLEAAATGRPVVTTNMPGCRDAVEDGVTGLICAPRNLESLLDAMQKFLALTDTEKSKMGAAARVRAEQEFDEGIVIEAYLGQLKVIDKICV